MKIFKKIFFVLFVLLLSFHFFGNVFADETEDKIKELDQKISEYQSEIARLNSQSTTLQNQIAQFNAQIKLTTLKVQKTEEQILLLSGRIDRLEVSLDVLTQAFSSRVEETYKMMRLDNPFIFLFTSNDLKQAMTRLKYLIRAQESDRELIERLHLANTLYKEEKSSQEELQEELEREKYNLASQKQAKNTLLEETKNDEKRFQQLLAEAQAQKIAFSRFVIGEGGASILSNQTYCDDWGCYYNQRDSLWGNISMGSSGLSMAGYGCLVTSVSMMASHQGVNIKPSDIANTQGAFLASTAYLLHSFNANGINVSITTASSSYLDNELNSGRPVIAGLYGGPDHFIVIKEKQGSDYIMYDPFMPDGYNKKLTEKYSLGAITSLRLVRFN